MSQKKCQRLMRKFRQAFVVCYTQKAGAATPVCKRHTSVGREYEKVSWLYSDWSEESTTTVFFGILSKNCSLEKIAKSIVNCREITRKSERTNKNL